MSTTDETTKPSEQSPPAVAPHVDEGTTSVPGPAAPTNQDSSNSPTATATATQSPTAHSNPTTIDATNPFNDNTYTAPTEGVEATPALPPRPEPTNAAGPAQETMASHVHFGDELPPPTTHATDDAPQQTQTHPGVAQLKGMFPDFDDALLYVLSLLHQLPRSNVCL